MSKKSTSTHKKLGIFTALSLVIGNIIGSGIYTLPQQLATIGTISIFGWLFTLVGSLLLAYVFSSLNQRMPTTGGTFLYAKAVYGEFMGFAMAFSYWLAWTVGNTAMAVSATGYIASFIPQASFPFVGLLIKIAIIWLVTIINILGLHYVGRIQVITTILKLIPLLAIAFFAVLHGKVSNLTHYTGLTNQSSFDAISSASILTFWAFIGIESAIVPANEITNTKTITRATMIGTFFTGLLYIMLSIGVFMMIPAPILKNTMSPLSDISGLLFGQHAGIWMAGFAIITIIGALNGSLLVQVQDAMAAAHHSLFPKKFGQLGRFNTPTFAFIISALVMTLLLMLTYNDALSHQFNFFLLLSTLSFLIPYFIATTAELMLLLKDDNRSKKKLIITFLASLYAFWMISSAGQTIIVYGCLFFFSLFWLYFGVKWFTASREN